MNQSLDPTIAHVVVDLPLDGPFDYLIPDGLLGQISIGMRVMVPFGPRHICGFVVGLAQLSHIPKLKYIKSRCDSTPSFDAAMLALALDFSRFYGCSQGEALSVMLPLLLRQGRSSDMARKISEGSRPAQLEETKATLFLSSNGNFELTLRDVIKATLELKRSVLILVPDVFYLKYYKAFVEHYFNSANFLVDEGQTQTAQLSYWLKVRGSFNSIILGTRSAVFAPIKDLALAIMIDEDNSSFKQEQSPLYETRDVLMMRQRHEGFNIIFCGATPSIDLWYRVKIGEVVRKDLVAEAMPIPVAIDLNDYKFLPGLLSVPLRNGIEATLKLKGKAILVLNRRGSYSLTRCQDCGKVLSCVHCDAALSYSRLQKKFQCNHCAFYLPGDAACAYCKKSNWKSVRMGVEQLQGELIKYFPTATITSFDGESKGDTSRFDILITTQAILRFKATLKVPLVAMIDFNAEINRMDIDSSFKAWSLARQLNAMATQQMFIQTRNNDHYVVKALMRHNPEMFFDEEFKLRKELGFAPFKHWVRVMLRSKYEKSAQEMAQAVYNELVKNAGKNYAVMSPAPDAVFKKRDQYRFNLSVQGEQVEATMELVKSALAKVKRSSRVIVTLNVD